MLKMKISREVLCGDWDEFCLNSDDCWFYHTIDFEMYTISYMNFEPSIRSFAVVDGAGDILAICPLLYEKSNYSYGGSFCPNIAFRNSLSNKIKKEILTKIFSEIDRMALEDGIKEIKMGLSSLSPNNLPPKTNWNWLMKYGFKNVSINTQILDLKKSEEELWNNIKRSHKNEIKKGRKLFKFSVYDSNNITKDSFDKFRKLHLKAAGRETRPYETWLDQYNWIEEGNAVLLLSEYNNEIVGGIYANTYKRGAYYGVSANNPDYDSLPIAHATQWEMIKWLRNNRYDWYELGYQQFGEQDYDNPTQKDIDISMFKRHFGGFTTTLYRGVKKY